MGFSLLLGIFVYILIISALTIWLLNIHDEKKAKKAHPDLQQINHLPEETKENYEESSTNKLN